MAAAPSLVSFEPGRYNEIPVIELLRAASRGWIGIDKRLIQSILDRGEAGMADVVAFSREPVREHRVFLDQVLIDLFHHSPQPGAIDFLIDAIRREPEDVDDTLVEALLPLGSRAVEALLKLYEELGEEAGSDVAFLLAGLRIRDPRVLALLLDRLEFDAADGAFCLGLYGDPAAKPALEKMLAELPESGDVPEEDTSDDNVELRREISHAIEALDAPETPYAPERFDILSEYPKQDIPAFDVLTETERTELLASPDPAIRAEAAYSFFNTAVNPKVRDALLSMAKSDLDPLVRARAWEALSDAADQEPIRAAMLATLTDTSLPVEERGGAAVGLYGFADKPEVQRAIEALYEEGGGARAKALETMWRSLHKPYSKYFAQHLDDENPAIVHQALRGAGYFRLTGYADKIAKRLDSDDFRDDALFAYTLALPGETTRGRARGILRKIDSITHLSPAETRLVMFAIDERLRLHSLAPVFESDSEPEPEAPPQASSATPGRNDPCPCGSGKKYKKCHGK